MKVGRLSSSERVALETLRARIVAARRWHHSEIARLDALWGGFPSEVARLSPRQRAIRLEVTRRQIAKMISMVPAAAFEPAPDAGPGTSPAAMSEEVGDQLPA
jgi:hypothetical protein